MSGRRPRPKRKSREVRAEGFAPRESESKTLGKTRSMTTARGKPTSEGRGEGRPHTRARAAAEPSGKGGSRNWPKRKRRQNPEESHSTGKRLT